MIASASSLLSVLVSRLDSPLYSLEFSLLSLSCAPSCIILACLFPLSFLLLALLEPLFPCYSVKRLYFTNR